MTTIETAPGEAPYNAETLWMRATVLSTIAHRQGDGSTLLYVRRQGIPWPLSEGDAGVAAQGSLAEALGMEEKEVAELLGWLLRDGYVQKGGVRAFTIGDNGYQRLWAKTWKLTPLGAAWLRAWAAGKAL